VTGLVPFPWSEAMRFGFGVMRLTSKDFWALTPRELTAAFEAINGARPRSPQRQELETLMASFPDKENENG
jgi:uncharacterized phage protein (TIGR02216 family)